jgi:hypothetical protein
MLIKMNKKDIEMIIDDPDEIKLLIDKAITSIIDPAATMRLGAVTFLRDNYYPEIRKIYHTDEEVIMETQDEDGNLTSYKICKLPGDYIKVRYETFPWDMGADLDVGSHLYL